METFLSVLVWTFALYGLFEIIKNILYICTYTHLNTKGIYLVLAVKNQEETIEYLLRNMVFRMLYGKEEIRNMMVVDLNSKDNTKKIVEKLEKEYEQIHLISWKDCRELLENIREN